MRYPAKIRREEDGFCVTFFDFDSIFTDGDTLEEAKKMAQEALTLYLEAIDGRKMSIPDPSTVEGDDVYYIEPDLPVSFAISLKKERQKKGFTQKEVAERLGVNWAMYQKLENPRRTNPTLTTIQKIQDVFGTSFLNC